ncbi:MAG TPA: ribonuclease HII [Patescibacteria group bacterium]|nr:ribonuclease HII [Patescibacteria group bacterium]
MTFKYEKQKLRQGYDGVIGCDEVGRGCLAGPVVAAAVALPQACGFKLRAANFGQIRDSKLLTPKKREELAEFIKENFLWSVARVSPKQIDRLNIHHATLLAMRLAVEKLHTTASSQEKILRKSAESFNRERHDNLFLFLDGKFIIPKFNMKQEAVVGGDNKVLSVAAASIVAKVYRDELMRKYHLKYPAYDFHRHKGYATSRHREMVKKYGLCKIHRLSFCTHLT